MQPSRGRIKAELRRVFFYGLPCVLLLLGIIYFFWVRPTAQLEAERDNLAAKEYIELKAGIRTGLAQAIGGAAFLIGLYFTWRNLKIAQETAANNLKNAHETLRLSQEGQITDRFTKAITQLGSDKVEIRLGGIYALERIARDSERDHWPIMEVLTTYLRENSRWKDEDEDEESSEDQDDDQQPELHDHEDAEDEGAKQQPADVQAILTVIGRRARTFGDGEEQPLLLESTDLRNTRLAHAHLEGAILDSANLGGSDLASAHLETAHLWHSHLENVNLWGAYLEGAVLWSAHLEGSFLTEACLENADLSGAFLGNVDMIDAKLNGANLSGAHLKGVDLSYSHGLKWEQIKEAIIDYDTKLPPELEERREAARDEV